jgi:hypothetical protein
VTRQPGGGGDDADGSSYGRTVRGCLAQEGAALVGAVAGQVLVRDQAVAVPGRGAARTGPSARCRDCCFPLVKRVIAMSAPGAGPRLVTRVPLGSWLVMFGGAAELIAVDREPCPGFPGARLVTIRSAAGGEEMSVLVPADFEPLVLPREYV